MVKPIDMVAITIDSNKKRIGMVAITIDSIKNNSGLRGMGDGKEQVNRIYVLL